MGLAISYKIIASHKGDIKVESEIGKGSKFIITIPINWYSENLEEVGK